MNESDELFEQVRDCAKRLKSVADTAWYDGVLLANDANAIYGIVADLRDIARALQHGPQ